MAATADSGVVLDFAEEVMQQLEADAQLELQALWQPLPAGPAKLALENKKQAALRLMNFLISITTDPGTLMPVS